jgi:ribonuclease Z
MKLNVLGSNGWFDTSEANTVCLLLETDDFYIVFDAGGGLYKLDEFVKTDKPVYLFLSHFHIDHIIGFHTLPKFRFGQGLTIFGQPGTKEILNAYINSPFTMPMEKLPYEVVIKELPEGESEVPFPVEAGYLVHSDPSFGYRLTIEDKVISYCTDTGYCDNLVKLAKEADLFITECALGVGEEGKPSWPHLNPEIAAKAAKDAQAKKLFLTHFGATNYLTNDDREKAKISAEETFSPVVVAKDGLEMDV